MNTSRSQAYAGARRRAKAPDRSHRSGSTRALSLCGLAIAGLTIVGMGTGGLATAAGHDSPAAAAQPTFAERITEAPHFGAHTVAIDAPERVPLGGYALRGPFHRSTGTRHAAEARALVGVADDGDTRVGLVTIDTLIVVAGLREEIAGRVEALGLDALVVVATHTHSGPGGYLQHPLPQMLVLGAFDSKSRTAIVDAAVAALEGAAERTRPARLAVATARAEGAIRNRRGGTATDPRIRALLVDGSEGPIATLFSFAAHPTILGPDNREIDPDFPGAARDQLDLARGGVSIFVPGAIADQNPALEGSSEFPEEVEARAAAARSVGHALASQLQGAPRLEAVDRSIAFSKASFSPPPIDVDGRCSAYIGTPVFHLAARSFVQKQTQLVALRLGPLRFVASPYELSVGVAESLRERPNARNKPGELLMIASHANEWLGYLLTPEDFDTGGYEACLSVHGREAAPRLVDALEQLLGELP